MSPMDLETLAFMANRPAGHPFVRETLLTPGAMSPPTGTAAAFRELAAGLAEALAPSPGLADLFRLHILALRLIRPDEAPPWLDEWLGETASPWLPRWRGRWRAVPLHLVNDAGATRRWLLVGVIPGGGRGPLLPPWAEPLADEAARIALTSALKAARTIRPLSPGDRALAFPLIVPNGVRQIRGASLGLPAALGWAAASGDAPLPSTIAATGAVTPDGRVKPVSGVEEKLRAAEDTSAVFLCPAENLPVPPPESPICLPVADLGEAWMHSQLYTPERAGRLGLMAEALRHPGRLVDNLADLPPDWITWAHREGRIQSAVTGVTGDPHRFRNLVDRFEIMVHAGDSPRASAVAGLLQPADLDRVRQTAPLAAFRWCAVNLSLANHRGRIDRARQWARDAFELLPEARRADIEAVVTFFNHFLVSRHSRYLFTPDLPEALDEILAHLERQHDLNREFGCPTFPVLGRLYGSIAQNFAFCGPDHLSRTEDYADRAAIALGRGAVPEMAPEWRRQSNYLVYARLDAGPDSIDVARTALFDNLAVETWSGVWDRLPEMSRWEHAVLARFCADCPDEAPAREYRDRAARPATRRRDREHPWQLIFWNLGRMAHAHGDDAAARRAFQESLDRCLHEALGESVRVMALLPLAGLHQMDALSDAHRRRHLASVREAAGRLSAQHFRRLDEASAKEILEWVWRHPAGLFPFSYH